MVNVYNPSTAYIEGDNQHAELPAGGSIIVEDHVGEWMLRNWGFLQLSPVVKEEPKVVEEKHEEILPKQKVVVASPVHKKVKKSKK